MTFQKYNTLVMSVYYVTTVHHLQSCLFANLSPQLTLSNNTTNLVHVGSALCLFSAFAHTPNFTSKRKYNKSRIYIKYYYKKTAI
jgi:hypothetical protein